MLILRNMYWRENYSTLEGKLLPTDPTPPTGDEAPGRLHRLHPRHTVGPEAAKLVAAVIWEAIWQFGC